MPPSHFRKMHGLGNDFVVIDGRDGSAGMTPAWAAAIGDRHQGVGFDQLALILPDDEADVRVVFYNSDGTTAGACGNATRCVARLLFAENGDMPVRIRTAGGLLGARLTEDARVSVNMGRPVTRWQDIPLSKEVPIDALPIDGAPSAIGMGNPHMVFVVDDVAGVDVAALGSAHEIHPLYPQRTNVEFCEVRDRSHVRLRVWERGTGITLACGSGACAAAVALHRRGLTEKTVEMELDGGVLDIDWRDDGVWMTGPTSHVFEGEFSADLFQ